MVSESPLVAITESARATSLRDEEIGNGPIVRDPLSFFAGGRSRGSAMPAELNWSFT